MLVRTLARILSSRGLEVAIFNRTDVMSGAWPVLPYTAVVVSPDAMERRRGSDRDDAATLARYILALPRGAIARHRDKIAAADGFVVTDETLEYLPSLVTLAVHGLSVMPRGLRSDGVQVSPRLERMKHLSAARPRGAGGAEPRPRQPVHRPPPRHVDPDGENPYPPHCRAPRLPQPHRYGRFRSRLPGARAAGRYPFGNHADKKGVGTLALS